MCIAIYKPSGAWATKQELRECYRRNPHGAGYAWLTETGVRLKKGFFSWRHFWRSYRQNVKTETQAFIHFRIATSGTKDAEHCHPFAMEHGVLMHNGPCLNHRYCKGDSERSDTRQFVEDFVDGLDSRQFSRLKPMIEDFAGYEKVAAMFHDGTVVICNENQGHWHNEIWWSNTSYLPRTYTTNVSNDSAKPLAVSNRTGSWHDWDDDYYGADNALYGPLHRTTDRVPYSSFASDEVWSTTLQRRIKKHLTITEDIYEWVEAESAYIMVSKKNDMQLFPLADELAIYSEDPAAPGTYIQVGYLIETVDDYCDVFWMSKEAERTAATA